MTWRAPLLALLPAVALAQRPLVLDPAFDHALSLAYLYNPQLLSERQRLRETDEGVPRALSGWRPNVQLRGYAGGSAVFDSIDTAHTPERRAPQSGDLVLTQPLYTGGRGRGAGGPGGGAGRRRASRFAGQRGLGAARGGNGVFWTSAEMGGSCC